MDFDPKTQEILPGPRDALSISRDYDTDPEQTYPVFLFVPDENKPEHWHLKLTRNGVFWVLIFSSMVSY